MTNMDKLYEAVEARGPVCVGLDTDFSYLPADFVDSTLSKGENIVRFNKKLIDATKAVAGCYKVQIAYYEALGLEGLKAYADTLKAVREAGVPVIADIKRGDIAKTAEMYAMGHFTGDFEADFVTLAPYMGLDSISPYLPYAEKQGKGMFVLCRTSNGGAKDFEYEKLAKELLKRPDVNFFHFNVDLAQGPCVIKRLRGCGCGNEYVAITPDGDIYPCHQFVGQEEFLMGNVDEGIVKPEIAEEFRGCSVYSKESCKTCFARFYCSGGCMANSYKFHHTINDTYEVSCEMERKRVECAIMIKAALADK